MRKYQEKRLFKRVSRVLQPDQVHHHLAAAIKGVTGVLLVYQAFEQHIDLHNKCRLTVCINSGPGHAGKRSLALLRQLAPATDP